MITAMLQAGLNGVDNGQLWFNNVRVPRDALLDRYASVAEDGTYSSPIPSVAQRFGTMVGGLTTGLIFPPSAGCLILRLPFSKGRACLSHECLEPCGVVCRSGGSSLRSFRWSPLGCSVVEREVILCAADSLQRLCKLGMHAHA